VAHGKIVPTGRTKVVQAPALNLGESGVFKAIAVEEGQHVSQGQVPSSSMRLKPAPIGNGSRSDAAQAHLSEVKAQIASTQRQKAQAEEEFKRDRLKELAEAETQAKALDQELKKAAERQRLKSITAPVAGTVQQLAVHTLGGIIQPG
jgi:multidrug efflux pump subunit AcrA (membrane-fusion protein)